MYLCTGVRSPIWPLRVNATTHGSDNMILCHVVLPGFRPNSSRLFRADSFALNTIYGLLSKSKIPKNAFFYIHPPNDEP